MQSANPIKKIFKHPLWLGAIALVIVATVALTFSATHSLERLDTRIQTVFDGPRWSIPARVYARPLELYQGLALPQQEIIHELQRLGYRQQQIDGPGQYQRNQNRLALQTRGFQFADGAETSVTALIRWSDNQITELTDTKGNDIPIIRLEPMLIGRISPAQSEDRLLVTLEQLPEGLKQALLAVEDPKFYDHFGLSIRGILRAVWVNLKERRFAQGGSTLTQQLVKNLFLTRERTLKRKLTEWPMAVLLERRYSKDEILQAFVNEVFFAQDRSRAIHGFGLGSYFFFDKPVQELQAHEYALLVGLLKGPSYYNPLRHPQRALARRNLVLRLMHDAGVLESLSEWQAKPLALAQRSDNLQQPAYLDLVRLQITRDYSTDDLHKNGLSIFTNFDPRVQTALETSVTDALQQIAIEQGLNEAEVSQLEVSAVVTSTDTGEVSAVIGGREPRFAGFNRALDAKRPIGSLIKPAIYLTALEMPQQYSLLTSLQDEPLFLEQPDGSIWTPNNFSGIAHGEVTLLEALTRSYNMAAVSTGLNLGVESVVNTLQRLDYNGNVDPLPAILLGAVDMNVVDVASVYQSFASGGFETPLRAIREIQARDGELLNRYPLRGGRNISAGSVHLINYAMQNVMREGTGRRAYRYIPANISLAGKSGTSNDQRDSWFAGFSGDYTATVWMGHDDNSPTKVTGSSGALEVWARAMAKINQRSLRFEEPDDIGYFAVNPLTGNRIERSCRNASYLPFYLEYPPAFARDGLLDSRCE